MASVTTASKSRVKELEKLLKEASDAYYNSSTPIMSDQDFDRLRDELEELDPDNTFLASVGAEPEEDSTLTKVKHSIKMGSLKKIKTKDEYKTWLGSVGREAGSNPEIAVQWKMDGSSLELVYRNGSFAQAITRGDGEIGEDVTHSICYAKNLPLTLPDKVNVSIRGEAILRISDWKKHLSKETKNPRNAAAGIVRRSDTKDAKHLCFLAFNAEFIGDGPNWKTEEDRMRWLRKAGFETVDTNILSSTHVASAVESLENNRSNIDFEVDGAVLKLNNIAAQHELGDHDGRPYWARAWKFAPMGAHTFIRRVEWNVGMRGTIAPVAIVDPVEVGGVTISRSTLCNMDEIERLGIHLGDEIEIIRANDVIPKIVRVVKPGSNRKTIECKACPHCNSPVKREGPHLVCSNTETCSGVQFRRLLSWAKKREIMYLGEGVLTKLFDSGIATDVIDLYSLDKTKMMDAGLGSGESDRLIPEIEKSRSVTLPDLIGSLSIDLLGRSEAKNISDLGFTDLSDWENLKPSDLMKHEGYGETSANRICDGLKAAWPTIKKLASILDVKKPVKKASGGALAGMSFCFTGEMSKPRKELEALVKANGGTINSVSKHLTYLVMADPNSGSGKAEKAKKLGVKTISEQQFLKMV
jgi:DNA ligase (NAD+)